MLERGVGGWVDLLLVEPRQSCHSHKGEILAPFGHKATPPLSHLYAEMYMHAHVRIYFSQGGVSHFLYWFHWGRCTLCNELAWVFFLRFEEDAKEEGTLPAPGAGGAYLRCPPKSPVTPCATPVLPHQGWAAFSLRWVGVSLCFSLAIHNHCLAIITFSFHRYMN